jgi:metallopeptidase MepB
MNAQLFELVEAVVRNQKNNNQEEVLDVESARLLERTHRLFLRNGLGLSTEYKRQLFREIGRRLTQLKQVFRENQIKKSGGLWFERKELEGLPEGVLEGLDREQGDADGNGDGDRKGGRLWLTFEYYHLIPTLRYIKMSETRKRCYIGYENKCKPNVAIFNETTVLRDEAARLLGYANHAAFRMEEKMAKTVETVNRFLSELRGKLSDYGTRELERLKALKMADLESKGEKMDGRFYLWDTEFYKNMLVEQEYKVDQQKIAQYFALEQVLPGLFKIFERLFGLRFMKLVDEGEGKGSVWHQDVRIFAVWNSGDEGGDFVGYLYLDLFKREGKLEQPFNVNLQPVRNLEHLSSSIAI